MYGSGEITDLAAKLTRFPIMCFRKSPSFRSSVCFTPGGSDAAADPCAPDLVASVLNVLLQKQPTAQALIADPVNRTLRTAFDIACAARGLRLAEGPMPGMEGMRLLSVSKQGYMA